MTRRIKTTKTSFKILELLKKLDGATMSELSERLELANSTIHGHLKTLEESQLIVKEGNEYYLGLRLFHYGNYVKQRKPEYQFVSEHVGYLADTSKENASFCVEEHGLITILSGNGIPDDPAYDDGAVFYMHETAAGKAILAEMSDERISEVIDQWGLPESTDQTITEKEQLLNEIEEIRNCGYAFNHEEVLSGLSSIGVVVKRPDSSVVGALTVGGSSYRIEGQRLEEEFLEIIIDAKESFEEDIRSLYPPM